jgi:hypothetical protein
LRRVEGNVTFKLHFEEERERNLLRFRKDIFIQDQSVSERDVSVHLPVVIETVEKRENIHAVTCLEGERARAERKIK